MNIEQHKLLMFRILRDAFMDKDLSELLAFKGGTALMFFYGLPRFSVDLDFNILDASRKKLVYEKMRAIALKYGTIKDEEMKFFGPLIVLNYAKGVPNLKIEMSTRFYDNHYETQSLAGVDIRVMTAPDMFAHKLCALLDRRGMAGRDVFDIHFFLERMTPIHRGIVENRMKKPLEAYLDDCIVALRGVKIEDILSNVGELLTHTQKAHLRSGKFLQETLANLEAFKFIPIIQEYPENAMILDSVKVMTNLQGEPTLSAIIEGKPYVGKKLTPQEMELLDALPKDDDKENFLRQLARDSYLSAWSKQVEQSWRGMKR